MGRSYFSVSNINRMVSAYSAHCKQQERDNLIASQTGITTKFAPAYELVSVEFNKETRVTRIVIEQTQCYRTIERYVTRNYEKYPIYSDVKRRTKRINKTIKLTNDALESLDCHEDALIREFAIEIVNAINDENLYPSWFIIWSLRNDCRGKVKDLQAKNEEFRQRNVGEIAKTNEKIKMRKEDIAVQDDILAKLIKRRDKLKDKIFSISERDKSLLRAILTLGIYAYLVSDSRKKRIESKLVVQEETIEQENAKKEEMQAALQQCVAIVKQKENDIKQNASDTAKAIKEVTAKCEENVRKVLPLPSMVATRDDSFLLLKNWAGYEYRKIVGCYVIRNREKDKYYVGQSKDVMKRIRQHFKGTVPANVIFAEDYYTSTFTNKEDLFEVKIIPCETKDELDNTERDLIKKYDSFQSGYNGTGGNK